jgi:hypothetical protein
MNTPLALIIKVVDRVTIALVILKLLKVLPIHWGLVFMPVWLFAALSLAILTVRACEVIYPSQKIRSS